MLRVELGLARKVVMAGCPGWSLRAGTCRRRQQ